MFLPIMVKVRPSKTGDNQNHFTLMLILPKEINAENPAPVSKIEGVFPIYHPEQILYARRFPGFAKEADWRRESLRIVEVCQEFGINSDEVISATYDMPMKLLNRRNEVLVAQLTKEEPIEE